MVRRCKNPAWIKHNCRVEWLEWNSFPFGKFDGPTTKVADNCTVEYNGKTLYTIIFKDGSMMNKKEGAKGFFFFSAEKRKSQLPGDKKTIL